VAWGLGTEEILPFYIEREVFHNLYSYHPEDGSSMIFEALVSYNPATQTRRSRQEISWPSDTLLDFWGRRRTAYDDFTRFCWASLSLYCSLYCL